MSVNKQFVLQCPVPLSQQDTVQLAHGGGGQLMHRLLEEFVIPTFDGEHLAARHDGAVLSVNGTRLAFTTDSYVVRPIFFPGGDIGSLAVNGTVNDLAMCGARPLYLSCGLILEEGFPLNSLRQVLSSMRAAADATGVQLVTGDTKVVDHGKGDGIFINTAGVGVIEHNLNILPASVREDDAVLLSGDLGRHSIAILSQRQGLEFETTIASDCAPLAQPVRSLLDAGIEIHCLRDLTRGGLATALIEIAEAAGVSVVMEEVRIPVDESVTGACEMLGFDPLYLANEGRFVAFVPTQQASHALEVLHRFEVCSQAAQIGCVHAAPAGLVSLDTPIGTSRALGMLSGEQLPRIC
jgi:hydrogenase expression/formation protein HypE